VDFVKGHGTRNDFVVVPDLDDVIRLDAAAVRAICDRRSGVGADGVLRVVRRPDADVRWFMDYRNADGSVAEMCGNGIRVVGRYLVEVGLEPAGRLRIDTRDGVKDLDVPSSGDVTVDMGIAAKGTDAKVGVGGQWWSAAGWSIGNPHLVVTDAAIDALDLRIAPLVDPAETYPDGVNVEFVEVVGDRHVRMRVHERGVGETQSCGTGACAAAVAVMASRDERGSWVVDVPGGRLAVTWREDGRVALTGPAVLVASGEYQGDAPA
jgi:diaminopimelate epimerase